MNYKESAKILAKIEKAKKILINLHRGPDGDSIGSGLALSHQLKKLNKSVDVVLNEKSEISDPYSIVPGVSNIKKVDFENFDFGAYDLFISPDSSDFIMVTNSKDSILPAIEIVVIDHHETNTRFGNINLVDAGKSSCAEIVYLFFKDCGFEIGKEVAQMLLIGILSDTDNFRFIKDYKTLINAAALMKSGADKRWIENNLFSTFSLNEMKLYGEYMRNMVLDKENEFYYTGINFETYKKYGKPAKISSKFATTYGAVVDGTNFGLVIYEKEPKVIDISLRGRDGFDISGLAIELGGGRT